MIGLDYIYFNEDGLEGVLTLNIPAPLITSKPTLMRRSISTRPGV
jgi:hypothetical protein